MFFRFVVIYILFLKKQLTSYEEKEPLKKVKAHLLLVLALRG